MGVQKKLMLEGKEFVCFILLYLHQGTVKGMKLDNEQDFAAQNLSTEKKECFAQICTKEKGFLVNVNHFYKYIFPYKRN